MFVLEEYDYKCYLAPKLSTSSLCYKDLCLDEVTDKVQAADVCITVTFSKVMPAF